MSAPQDPSRRHGATSVPAERHDLHGVHLVDEPVVVERPLHFVVNARPVLATMRTPGFERELVLGYLVTEGLLEDASQLLSAHLRPGAGLSDTICVELHGLAPEALEKLRRVGASVSSCGVCGRQGEEPFIPRAPAPVRGLEVPFEALPGMLARAAGQQALFAATGGLHAASIFDAAEAAPLVVMEDIGRHNAIDKAVGWLLERGLLRDRPLALVSSGRASFEVVQKAAMAGIGTVISVSAASSMAIEVARALELTLIGFVRADKALVYHRPGPGPFKQKAL